MIGLAQNSYNYQGNERVHLGPVEVQARNATVSLDGEKDWLLKMKEKICFTKYKYSSELRKTLTLRSKTANGSI
jgi:hypothetical protein